MTPLGHSGPVGGCPTPLKRNGCVLVVGQMPSVEEQTLKSGSGSGMHPAPERSLFGIQSRCFDFHEFRLCQWGRTGRLGGLDNRFRMGLAWRKPLIRLEKKHFCRIWHGWECWKRRYLACLGKGACPFPAEGGIRWLKRLHHGGGFLLKDRMGKFVGMR